MICNDIQVLLHIFAHPVPFTEVFAVEVVQETAFARSLNNLSDEGLIEQKRDEPCGYICTDRGRVYAEALRDLPLPVQEWRMP